MVTVFDGNFLGAMFEISVVQIDKKRKVLFGNMPQSMNDFEMLRGEGCKHILALTKIKGKLPFPHTEMPLESNDDAELCFDMLKICKKLESLLAKGTTYICCGAGRTRSPTLLLAYLCLYKKIPEW